MAQEFFDPVLFIKEDAPTVVDLSQTPFFCNLHGYPHYCAEPPAGLTVLEPDTLRREITQTLKRTLKGYRATTTEV